MSSRTMFRRERHITAPPALVLLLFFAAGAIAEHRLRLWEGLFPAPLPPAAVLPVLLASAALLAGAPSGLWTIPVGACFLGVCEAHAVAEAVEAMRLSLEQGIASAAPGCLSVLCFFLTAAQSMEISARIWACGAHGEHQPRGRLRREVFIVWLTGFVSALAIYFMTR